MILLNINKSSSTPVYIQVKNQIVNLIESNALKPGDILPATRKLAKELGLNRITVCKAYDDLWALGYIESNQGSYSKVRKRAKIIEYNENKRLSLINWTPGNKENINESLEWLTKFRTNSENKEGINFRPLSPDPKLMPNDEYRKCLNNALKKSGSTLLDYGNQMGYKELRVTICNQLNKHSIDTSIKEILITNGTQNALELLLRYFYFPDASVIVESPTYSWFIPLLKLYHYNIIEIPMLPDGMDLVQLEKKLQTHSVTFVYTIPNCQNPTGISTDQAHREKLLSICEIYKTPIIEDGFEEEMKYFGKKVLPLKSIDKNNIVIYLGTYSKILFPGERIGWICAPDALINSLAQIKYICNTPGNLLSQMALTEFYISGKYDLHIKRIHNTYKKRMHVALKIAKELLEPLDLYISKPAGGYTFWIEIKVSKYSEAQLLEKLNKKGVFVTPGSFFYPNKNNKVAFRISIAHVNAEEITEGLKKIAEVISTV